MMASKKTIALFSGSLLFLMLTSIVHAEYIMTGPAKGEVCAVSDFLGCKFHPIAGIKGDDGRPYELARSYPKVSDYNESKKRCWINTKSTGLGVFSFGINMLTQPVFLELSNNGVYKEIDVGVITFPCIKR